MDFNIKPRNLSHGFYKFKNASKFHLWWDLLWDSYRDWVLFINLVTRVRVPSQHDEIDMHIAKDIALRILLFCSKAYFVVHWLQINSSSRARQVVGRGFGVGGRPRAGADGRTAGRAAVHQSEAVGLGAAAAHEHGRAPEHILRHYGR